MYDSTLLEEYELAYDLFLAESEFNEQIFQLECGIMNESTGLMCLNESFIDTLKGWFEKIQAGIDKALEKLKMKLNGISDNAIKSISNKITSPNRPDPAMFKIEIHNYHTYNFDKFAQYNSDKFFKDTDYVQCIAGMIGGSANKVEGRKEEILKKVYPDLYDEKMTLFDKMRMNIMTSGKDNDKITYLDNAMLDSAWKFVSETYKNLIDSIEKDKNAIKAQKKNVDSVVQQLRNADVANKMAGPTEVKNESFLCESYLLLEAKPGNAKINTKVETSNAQGGASNNKPVQNQTITSGEDKKDNRAESRRTYVKAFMQYISVATNVISAKSKLTNRIYIDKWKIVSFYCKKAEFKITPLTGKGQTRQDRKDIKVFKKQLAGEEKK